VCDSKHLGYHGPMNNGLPCSFERGVPWKLTEDDPAGFYRANRQ
jgi:hypothetical protein